MFQDLIKDKNTSLNMMVFSAIIIILTSVYVVFKNSQSSINSGNYLIGIGILAFLLVVAFILKLKEKKNTNTNTDKNYIEPKKQIVKELTDSSSSIQPVTTDINFSDIAGIASIKDELIQIVDFLNMPEKYLKYDVSLPKGVLLIGPPGVGKTMIAKAVANEANVPFYYQSGASFVHIYVGMGAKKVRDLFNIAKAKSPSIVFIDEIDAVGKSRGASGNDEREATLNELLTQMDGFDDKSTVMVIAATNKVELLDEALLRAGRFDRRIYLQLPTKEDRIKILQKACKNKVYKFNLTQLAYDTAGFNSAALITLINEAVLNMIKREDNTIIEEDISISKQKVQFGKKQIKILNQEQKDILATYQATKAFITKNKVILFEEGILFDDLIYPSKKQLKEQIYALLSGSVGIEVFKNDKHIVFEDEINEAYKIADDIINKYKFSSLSVDKLISQIKKTLKEDIKNNKSIILKLKDELLENEVVYFDNIKHKNDEL
jgi:cell division protease FtsH